MKKLPQEIQLYIADHKVKKITKAHRSGDLVYQIGDQFILKISNNIDRLRREKDANDFLKGKVPASETVCYIEEENRAYYLKTQVKGNPLVQKNYLSDPHKLVKLLAEAMRMFHSIDISDCDIYNAESVGDCFIHGDFCLPNILARNNKIAGFIDTEASGIGDPWMDYAWCIWSFEYNLGTDQYTDILLKELGIEFDREKLERYTSI